MTGNEIGYISEAHARGKLSGDGHFTKLCSDWLQASFGTNRALLTHSCTGALEMAAILVGIEPGDEIIMPSYTFVSTANAFVLRGGVPVFVDIKLRDQNIDESLIEQAITPRTKAIVPVHYGGVACEMDVIMDIAQRHGLFVIEDAAQAIFSTYKGRQLGTIGHLGCFSFHETKNVISGEGGALLVNDQSLIERSEIIREKGTDRSKFFRGQVDKYTWQDIGSSFLPGEVIAAFLWAQLQEGEKITRIRKAAWNNYHRIFSLEEHDRNFTLPTEFPKANAHMYQVLLHSNVDLNKVLNVLTSLGITAVTHYVALHSSNAGRKWGKSPSPLPNTEKVSSTLIRLPLFPELELDSIERVCKTLSHAART
jgi:dTDP-4-amino-4,6-dideoxygalactose transaminase